MSSDTFLRTGVSLVYENCAAASFSPETEDAHPGYEGRDGRQSTAVPKVLAQEYIAVCYEELRPSLCAFLRRRNLAAEDIEDVVQEAFLRLLSRSPKDLEATNVRFWLFRVAHNLMMDVHRAAGKRGLGLELALEVTELAASGTDPDPEGRILSAERWRQFDDELAVLTPRQRSAIYFRICGASSKEMAALLNTTPHNADELIRRGINRLGRGGRHRVW